jgi:negative regulator of replication initiation
VSKQVRREKKAGKRMKRSSRRRRRLLSEHERRDLDGNSHKDPKFQQLLAQFARIEKQLFALKDKRLHSRARVYGSKQASFPLSRLRG